MQALIVVDAQNEFSAEGLRHVPNHARALDAIRARAAAARAESLPIAWVQHHNKPNESRAFVPGSWGAALSPGLGPRAGDAPERLFMKDVFGAFTRTGLEEWLRSLQVTEIVLVGFYTHACLSTSAREGLIRGFEVIVDPQATGARDLDDPVAGRQSAEEVKRSALLHLTHMGARLASLEVPMTPTPEVASR